VAEFSTYSPIIWGDTVLPDPWSHGYGWLHLVSDVGIWSAYLAITIVFAYFLIRRRDTLYRKPLFLVGAFLLTCGTSHLLDAILFWWPAFRLAGLIKLFSALISWCTLLAVIRMTPLALTLRNPAELEQEIAERKRVEAALRNSEERYRQLFEANPHPMWVYDAETFRFLAVNNVALWHYGYTLEQFLGMTVQAIAAPDLTPVSMGPDRSRNDVLCSHRLASGEIRQVEVASLPIEFGGRAAWLVLALDVTEQKMLEEQLKQAQKLESIGQLAAGIAHEINTPIQYIGDNTNFLATSFQDMNRVLELF
jgi:PAS domain S-box-containing protein